MSECHEAPPAPPHGLPPIPPGMQTTDTPRGYGPLTGEWRQEGGNYTKALPQRVCLRCGAVVADPARHDRWHGAMDK